jgi:hypothetical protein
MADDIGWEAVTLKGELAHRVSLISISLSSQPSLCDKAPKTHSGVESQMPWLKIDDALPKWRTEDDPYMIAAETAAKKREG